MFSGLLRLAPKITKPESIPAEWRALSKLKRKKIIDRFYIWPHFQLIYNLSMQIQLNQRKPRITN